MTAEEIHRTIETVFRMERAKLIAAGRARSDELIFEEWLSEDEPSRGPETKPWTMTQEEWVSFLNEAEPR